MVNPGKFKDIYYKQPKKHPAGKFFFTRPGPCKETNWMVDKTASGHYIQQVIYGFIWVKEAASHNHY